jgi:hypothetical protein
MIWYLIYKIITEKKNATYTILILGMAMNGSIIAVCNNVGKAAFLGQNQKFENQLRF